MTREEQLACLTDRPCSVCKHHTEEGCSKWSCVFEEEPDDAENKGEWIAYDHGMGLVYLKCPFCGAYIDKRHVAHNFCGKCGAKLSGEKSGFER